VKCDAVTSKEMNYRLWQRGELGNKLRAWRSVEEWRASGFSGSVVLRTVGIVGGPCAYNLANLDEVNQVFYYWLICGVPRESIMVNEAAPDQNVVLQGEYLNDPGLCWAQFVHSRERAHMRDALKASKAISAGLRTILMLQEAMTPSSYSDWQLLLDRYPGHVLEVSIYDRCLGDTPGRNALVWEVRKY